MDPIIIVILLVCAFVGGMAGGATQFALLLGLEGVAYFAFGPWESVIFAVFGCVGTWVQLYLTIWSQKRAQAAQQRAQGKTNEDFHKRYGKKV